MDPDRGLWSEYKRPIHAIHLPCSVHSWARAALGGWALGLTLLFILWLSAFQPVLVAASPRWVGLQASGYWQFVGTTSEKQSLPPEAASVDVSVSEGAITFLAIWGDPMPRQWSFDCTWTVDAPNGLDRLTPSETVHGSMTVTDQSELYTAVGGSIGYNGVDGVITFGKAGDWVAANAQSAYQLLMVGASLKQTSTQNGDAVVPEDPGDWDGRMGLITRCGTSTFERTYEWVAQSAANVAITATPKKPSTPGIPTPTPSKSGGLSWVVVVGGIAAVGAAALAAIAGAAILAATILRRSGKKAPSQPPAPPQYILQLSAQALEVRVGQSATLEIQAWRITPQGGTVPAPEAAIQVSLPPSPAGLAATPAAGQGTLACAFSSLNPTQCARVTATITASAGGLGTSAQVIVSLLPVYELQIASQDPQNRVLPGGPGLWAWAKVAAIPPDPQSPLDQWTSQIGFRVQGPNSDWIRCQPPAPKDGQQWVQLLAEPPAQGAAMLAGNPVLIASCMAGTQRLEASLGLVVNEVLVLGAWAQGKKLADVIYQDTLTPPDWFFGGLTVYFHPPEDENKPVPPSFTCNLSSPTVLTDPPDLLELRNYNEKRPGYVTWEVFLRGGTDLEQVFGPELTDKNAQIQLTITVTSDEGKPYPSTVTYQLCPTAELVVRPCDTESGSPIQERVYKGLNLRGLEFLSDGADCLGLMIYYRRTDWPPDSERWVRSGRIIRMELRGPFSAEYQLGEKEEPFVQVEGNDGLWYSSVSALKPRLATAERQKAALSLHVEGQLAGRPPYYRIKTADLDLSTRMDTLDQALQPRFLYINQWVTPGWKTGTSIAGAVVLALQPDGKPLLLTQEYALELCTRSNGPGLSVGETQSLTGTDKRGNTGFLPLPDWLKAWRLTYSGLSWEAIKQARFEVLCRFAESDEAVEFKIDIEENGSAMFAALISDGGKLDLANPEWDEWENMWSFALLNKIILPDFRGPIYNIRRAVYLLLLGEANTPPEYRHYSCGDYSMRIRTYLHRRRHIDPNTAQKMNGLEVCSFVIPGTHDWAGIYLSGMDPKKDPIFIDPWYEQKWTEKATLANYGYKYQAVRFTAACSGAIAELYLLGRFILQCMRVKRGTAPLPSLADVTAALRNVSAGLRTKLTALLSEIAGGGLSWTLMKPNNDIPEQDADLNYVFEKELDLFDQYREELGDADPLPPVKAVSWPKAS